MVMLLWWMSRINRLPTELQLQQVLSRLEQKSWSILLQALVAKGDVLGVARVAGIMSVKHTSDLVPMCHPLPVTKCTIDFEIEKENGIIRTFCTVKTDGKTGVEMEALTGVQVTLLTIYDMCKAIDKHMVMTDIHLVEKTGGKSGDFLFKEIKTKGGEK